MSFSSGGGTGGSTFNAGTGASQAGATVGSGGNTATPTIGLSPYPNQQIAPLTNQQLQGMGLTSAVSPATQNYLGNMMNASNYVGSGGLMNPSTNPYLSMYYNAAALPTIQNYQQAIMPNIMQNMASTGTLGSSGYNQAMTNAQSSLAQGLGNLAANIYEPAYNQGVNAMMTAQGMAPSMATAQYTPANALLGSGQVGQTQSQNVLNALYQNLYQQANWPFQALNMLGQFGNTAAGGGTQGTVTGTTTV